MKQQHKILIVDDEQDLLDLYRALLSKLPSEPEIHTADSGSRALTLLNSDTFDLLITDLNMPKMDGFQLLTVTRRRFPSMKTAVISGISDEQFRARAYGMGIDLYLEKPNNDAEISMFADCIESLIERESAGGFRGFQSMTLVDLIQAESMSGSSCILKITNAGMIGQIWIDHGDIIDSTAQGLEAEEAFQKILEWRSGTFEKLPPDPNRERKIFNSVQGLLLDSAQTLDQAQAIDEGIDDEGQTSGDGDARGAVVGPLSRIQGVEFVLTVKQDQSSGGQRWGVEDPEATGRWVQDLMTRIRDLGSHLNVGIASRVTGVGLKRHVAVLPGQEQDLCVGLLRSMSQGQVRETLKEISSKWAS